MKYKRLTALSLALGLLLSTTAVASAHMVVKPSTAGIASVQNFSLGVPTEKDGSTVGVRLLIPAGLDDVTPDVKPGWKIDIKHNGTGDNAPVTEIDWMGGNIPSGQRDEFIFSAQVPASPTTLQWKAYQTYADGSVVSWDQSHVQAGASAMPDNGNSGPYSTTDIVNDLTASPAPTTTPQTSTANQTIMWVAYGALLVSIVSLAVSIKKSMA